MKKFKSFLAVFATVSIVLWFIDLLLPYTTGKFVDCIVQADGLQVFLPFILFITILNFLRIGMQYIKTTSYVKLSNQIQHSLCNEIFQKMYISKYSDYCNMDDANYADMINKDANIFTQFFCSNLCSFCLQMVSVVACGIVIGRMDKTLCLVVLALLPVYVVTYLISKGKMYTARNQYKNQSNKYFSSLFEQIDKYKFVARNVLNKEMEQRLNHAFYQFQASTSQCISVEFFFTNLNMIFIVASYSLILFIGGYKVITGQLTIGSFTIINTYYNQIIQSLSYYLGFAGKIQDLKTSYARILKILKSEIELSGVHELHTLEHIKINNLSVASDSGIMLAPQTLEFHRGQIYGIKGVNGSGKTTFFNSLIGLYPADKTGTILYNGLPIEMLDMKLFRRNSVSYLEQETTLMNMSIQEYLQLGVSQDDETIQRQQRLIEYFDINKTLDLGKSINSDGNLSGGERQKLSLIRSFSKKCDLYLLDEPTSALDSISTHKFLTIINCLKQDSIVILISHDDEVIKECDSFVEFN